MAINDHMSPAIYPAAILKESSNLFPFAPYMPAAIRAIGPTCTPIYGLIKAHVGGRIPTKRARVSTSLYLPLPPSRLRLSLLLILFPFLPHCNITMITSHII